MLRFYNWPFHWLLSLSKYCGIFSGKVDEKSVSAINLKTGSSVISLDLIGVRQQQHQPGGGQTPSTTTRRSILPSAARASKQRRRPSQSSQQASRDGRRNGNSSRRLSSTRAEDSTALMEGGNGSSISFPSIDSEESDQVLIVMKHSYLLQRKNSLWT